VRKPNKKKGKPCKQSIFPALMDVFRKRHCTPFMGYPATGKMFEWLSLLRATPDKGTDVRVCPER